MTVIQSTKKQYLTTLPGWSIASRMKGIEEGGTRMFMKAGEYPFG
jgi:hypothetical protein